MRALDVQYSGQYEDYYEPRYAGDNGGQFRILLVRLWQEVARA
jgi:hypothetical protein